MDESSIKSVLGAHKKSGLRVLLRLVLILYLPALVHGQIQINEIISSSSKGLIDENGDTPDWIELTNRGLSSVNLKGFSLSDNVNDPQKWVFDKYEIKPDEHLLVFASGKDRQRTLSSEPTHFDPSKWPSLTTWLMADDAISELDGESHFVKEWPNKLQKTWSLEAPSEINRPQLITNTLNGHAAIHFNQSQQFLRTANIPSNQFASRDAMTLFIVQRYSAPRHNGASIRFITQQNDGFNLLALWSNGALYFDFGNIDRRGRLATEPPKSFIDKWNLITLTRTPKDTTTIHVNGTLIANGEMKTQFAAQGKGELVIGDFDFHGQIAEIIGFKDALPTSQRTEIETYLATKYELAYHGAFFHTNFKIKSEGESVYLYSPQSTIIDQSPKVKIPTDVSLGRETNSSNDWKYFPNPTPRLNNTGIALNAPPTPPHFSHTPGFYEQPFQLKLSHPNPKATIRYTTDGSEPDETSPVWQGNLTIPEGDQIPSRWALIPTNPSQHKDFQDEFTMPEDKRDLFGWRPPRSKLFRAVTVRARAFSNGALASEPTTHTFFVTPEGKSRFSLPIINLSIDPYDWFNEKDGLYVHGQHYKPESWQHRFWGTGNYFLNGRFSEREAHLEFFNSGELKFSGNIGLKIHGGGSRAQPQKSLRLIARNAIGPDAFTFFPGQQEREFSQLTLRNAGQDAVLHATMLRDILIQAMAPEESITQSSHPVIVFLNGEYWGIHHLQEHFNSSDLKERFTLGKSKMDLLEVNAVPKEGDSNDYEFLLEKLRERNTENPDSIDEVLDLIDQENFIDHYVTQIYFDNVDWPGNNVAFFKTEPKSTNMTPHGVGDGKWRWLTYGVEAGMGMNDDITHHSIRRIIDVNFADGSAALWSTELFRTLIKSESFRHALINRFAGLLNTRFSTANVLSMLEEKVHVLSPEIEEHTERWRRPESIDAWHSNLDVIRSFAKERPEIQRRHWIEAFDLSGVYQTQLTIAPSNGGDVKIHRSRIGDFSQHLSSGQSNWMGTYFKGIPITFEAIPSEGFRFVNWNGDVQSETNPLTIKPISNINISANFKRTFTIPIPHIFIHDEMPILSFQITKEEDADDYSWEISRDLQLWTPLKTSVISREQVDANSYKISSRISESEIRNQALFFRIGFKAP